MKKSHGFKTDFHQFSTDSLKGRNLYKSFSKSPTEDVKKDVMQYLTPTITSAIKSYAQGDTTLKMRANILAMKAFGDYNLDSKAAPKTYVYNRLKKLIRYKSNRDETLHVPERSRLLAQKVTNFTDSFENSHDRPPSELELTDGLGVSLSDLKRSRTYGKELSEGFTEGDQGEVLGVQVKSDIDMIKDYIYYDLDNVNRKIFEWNTGYNGVKTIPKQQQAKRLKISPAAISSRIATIQKRLEDAL